MARYQLLTGEHVHLGKTFNAGDIIETDEDLVERWGPLRVKLLTESDTGDEDVVTKYNKEGEVVEGTVAEADENVTGKIAAEDEVEDDEAEVKQDDKGDDLDSKTVVELRDVAKKEEVDLKGVTHKDEIVDAINKARKSAKK